MRLFSVVLLIPLFCVAGAAQNSAAGEYDDPDAYEIYSLLLPGEQSYAIAKGTLVIQHETVVLKLDNACFAPAAAAQFKDAIEDYGRHIEPILLQRRFRSDKPYELVNAATIETLIKDYDWEKWYPESGGIIRMTAVGFDRRRTVAIVNTGSIPHPSAVDGGCNNLCSHDSFHLLKRTDGKWKPVPLRMQCFVVR